MMSFLLGSERGGADSCCAAEFHWIYVACVFLEFVLFEMKNVNRTDLLRKIVSFCRPGTYKVLPERL